MATRFYFSSSATAAVSPAFAAWDRTTEAQRRPMSPTKDGSANLNRLTWTGSNTVAANQRALCQQFVSDPLNAGVAFSTSDTFSMQAECIENAASSNINRQPVCIKVYSFDGLTLRATLKALGHYGPNTNEWSSVLPSTNKTFANAVALDASYTTVSGDRLVLEVGAQVDATGGTSVAGLQQFGSAAASDLGVNETEQTGNNPWFEISTAITFALILTGQSMTASRGSPVPGAGATVSGQSMTAAGGTITNGVPLTGQSMTAASYNSFFSGITRAYLSWADLQTPGSTVTNVALTGQGMTASGGTLVAGTARAYLSWANLNTPQPSIVNLTLTGQSMTAARGTLTAIAGGTLQQLTGQSATFSGGTLGAGATPLLSSPPMTITAGTLKASDENFIFSGFVTPLVSMPLSVGPMQMQSGFLGVLIDGATSVTLVGQPMTAGGGTMVPEISAALLGNGLTLSPGVCVPATDTALLGSDLALSGGSLTAAVGDVTVRLTGQAMQSQSGAFHIDSHWTDVPGTGGVWTNVGQSSGTWTNA